ncbi:MAG: ROK family transcriptional regulator [Paracoccaceae bacterium]
MQGGRSLGLRAYNERLVLSLLLRAGALSKAAIARETGLSGQAAAVIVNRLLDDGLLLKRDKVRGQVGQPSTPVAPNPEGAYALGVKIGRSSVEAVLVNLVGDVVADRTRAHDAPLPAPTMACAADLARALLEGADPPARERIVGLGIAMPDGLEGWAAELGLPADALAGWAGADVEAALSAATGLEATRCNDAAAACAAEMIAGRAIASPSALYVYLGTFVGGGVVLDGRLHLGRQRNAGALASMLVAADPRRQLLHEASLGDLARRLAADGIDVRAAFAGEVAEADAPFEDWLATAAPALARAVAAALAVIDFETVVVDGLFCPAWRARVVERIEAETARLNRAGLAPAAIVPGSLGATARVLGAAFLPLGERFSPDAELLLRSQPPADAEPASTLRRSA